MEARELSRLSKMPVNGASWLRPELNVILMMNLTRMATHCRCRSCMMNGLLKPRRQLVNRGSNHAFAESSGVIHVGSRQGTNWQTFEIMIAMIKMTLMTKTTHVTILQQSHFPPMMQMTLSMSRKMSKKLREMMRLLSLQMMMMEKCLLNLSRMMTTILILKMKMMMSSRIAGETCGFNLADQVVFDGTIHGEWRGIARQTVDISMMM